VALIVFVPDLIWSLYFIAAEVEMLLTFGNCVNFSFQYSKLFVEDQIKESVMGGACGTHGRGE
jgi:hypothetical protein